MMFGDVVTANLAESILDQFLADGTVTKTLEAADGAPLNDTPDRQTKYLWSWQDLPSASIDESDLVAFLNNVTDKALSTAKSILEDDSLKARNRFAAPIDKTHGIIASYEPDGEYMHPDFMVLPLAAFSDDHERKLNGKYINFTAMLLVGESTSPDNPRDGLIRLQRRMRGIKRAQPWLRFTTGMMVCGDFVVLLRGTCSGFERIELSLADRLGCLEFIRIVLGIVLADKIAFGHNPAVEIGEKDVGVDFLALHSTDTPHHGVDSTPSGATSRLAIPTVASELPETSNAAPRAYAPPTGFKRGRSQSDESNDEMKPSLEMMNAKRRKTTVKFRAFIPIRVYGHQCLGILFTSGSIRGRGTTVYAVAAPNDDKTYLALKTSWNDVARADDQAAILKKLRAEKSHPNVVIPLEVFQPKAEDGCVDSTLGLIREFLAEDIQHFQVENRILTVTISELRRPVAYFWSPHDFVRGVLGALLGHEYLCKIGILHCDISENNIVLSLCRGGLGALIDFDMAAEGHPNMHNDPPPSLPTLQDILASLGQPRPPSPVIDKPYVARSTSTAPPYMSIDALRGKPHTYFDDIESFLYVVVLFFFSYKGPLEEEALKRARAQGFVQPIGGGRLPHVTSWPDMFELWASGSFTEMSNRKFSDLSPRFAHLFLEECYLPLRTRWAHGSDDLTILRAILKLIVFAWMLFPENDRKVNHRQFGDVLRKWLKECADEESRYVYPFDD